MGFARLFAAAQAIKPPAEKCLTTAKSVKINRQACFTWFARLGSRGLKALE